MPAPLSPRLEATILPSLPPSPSLLEEVFSLPHAWGIRHDEFDLQGSRRSSSPGGHSKGKGKQTSEAEEEEDDADTPQHLSPHEAYPPTTDEVAETRRVEETLRRWELAERQRRKSARASAQHTSGPSLLSSVTRTASLVLSGRTASAGVAAGSGGTRTFKSHGTVDAAREGYAVPLDDVDRTRLSGDVVVHSPSPSRFDRSTSLDAGPGTTRSGSSENPFVHPSESARLYTPSPTPTLTPTTPTATLPPSAPSSPSPFSDTRAQQGSQANINSTMRPSADSKAYGRKRFSRSQVPLVLPPRPLGLSPPPDDVPRATPLQPTSQPILRSPPRERSEERDDARWWHEWLCGCGEGPDRGGDNQAGRTNPFE